MNDCLAATGSTAGLDPLIGALVLLLLGAGVAALAWRHRRRAAAGIALLPLVLGVLLFSGLSGAPAQAASCPPQSPPPAACTPIPAIESVALSAARFEFGADEGGLFLVPTLTGGGADELAAFLSAAAEAGATSSGVLTLTTNAGTVVFFFDEDGYLRSAVPALPDDFTGSDVYVLIYTELITEQEPFVPAEWVVSITYSNGCEDAHAELTVTGGLITYL